MMSSLEFANVEDFDDEVAEENELYEHIPEPVIPTVDTDPFELATSVVVDYSTRGPRDVVMSGPIANGWGPGRAFKGRRQAYIWAATKYGSDRVQPVKEVAGRWAFLIKNLREG